jgi:hypothetical protein
MGNDPGNGTDPSGGFTEPFSTLGNVVVTAKAKAGTTIKAITTGQQILSTVNTVFRYTNKLVGGDVFETSKDLGNFHVDETDQVWHRLGDGGQQSGTLTEYKPDFFDRWSESNNLFAQISYGIVDGGGLFIQALTPGVGHANAYHLNGSGANPTEVTEGGVGTMGVLLPGGAGGRSLGWFKLARPATKGMAAKGVTTADGFLFRGFTINAPFNIPVQRFGNMSIVRPDFWGARIGTSKFANRTFGAIKPAWNPLSQYTKGVIPKGTPIKFGIIGPQGWRYPGGSLQFIVPSRSVINQSTKLIP